MKALRARKAARAAALLAASLAAAPASAASLGDLWQALVRRLTPADRACARSLASPQRPFEITAEQARDLPALQARIRQRLAEDQIPGYWDTDPTIELMRQVRSALARLTELSAEEKAAVWKRFAGEAFEATGGYWRATAARGEQGEWIFVGTVGHALLIRPDGTLVGAVYDQSVCGRLRRYLGADSGLRPGDDPTLEQAIPIPIRCFKERRAGPRRRR